MAATHGIARNQRMMSIKIALAKRIASTPAVFQLLVTLTAWMPFLLSLLTGM